MRIIKKITFKSKSNFSNSWKSVIVLLFLMIIISSFGRLSKLLEVKSVEAQEAKIQAEQVKKEAEKVKEEKEELLVQLRIPNKQRVYKEVDKLFGKHAQEAKLVISCENASTEVDRININKNNTADFGPFQINLIHAKRFGTKFMVDPIENVKVAYKLFDEQGWNPWYSSASCHKLVASK